MATKHISTYSPGGYYFTATSYQLVIDKGAGFGLGLGAVASATIVNYGRLGNSSFGAYYGVDLQKGGAIQNGGSLNFGAVIQGFRAIGTSASSSIQNFGTILGSHLGISSYGSVINGAVNDTGALISGADGAIVMGGAISAVTNFGTILGNGGEGVQVNGGSVMNGAPGDVAATIVGGEGVFIGAAGAVTNFGTIIGQTVAGVSMTSAGTVTNGGPTDARASISGYYAGIEMSGAGGQVANFGTIVAIRATAGTAGVLLGDGGRVTNGSALDTTAMISGYTGVSIYAGLGATATSVVNYGTIAGQGVSSAEDGVFITGAAIVVNGSAGDRTARIIGATGVGMVGANGNVFNFGTIQAAVSDGINLAAGGVVINGGGRDNTALIDGAFDGVMASGGYVVVENRGAISGQSTGVALFQGGVVVNGSQNNNTARIEGYQGLVLYATSTATAIATNFGIIRGMGDNSGAGVDLYNGANLTNGSAGHAGAVVDGYVGVQAGMTGSGPVAGTTVTNFGTITGEGGTAVQLGASNDLLVVEAGCVFNGRVLGGGGAMDLASGIGTISGLGNADVVVSGSLAPTTFSNFNTTQLDGGAQFVLAGNGAVGASQELIDHGALTVAGTLSSAGALLVSGTLSGPGSLTIAGGLAAFGGGAGLSIASISVGGGASVIVAGNVAYAGTWNQTAGSLQVNSLVTFTLGGAANTFSGVVSGPGAVALSGTTLTIGASGASLSGLGGLTLAGGARIVGATPGAAVTNVNDVISGSGNLGGGSMTLANQSLATIDANGATALIIDTGANTVNNAGLLEAMGGGGLTIQSAVQNTGTIAAMGGNVTVNGAVTGSGLATVNGGTLDFNSTFAEGVTFTGATGILALAKSQAYTGAVTGLSKTGGSSLDLLDIGFVSSGEASFSGTKVGGVLTVTDGVHTAHIKLKGNYLASVFVAASDGHGGVIIHDPPAGPTASAFVSAMAGLSAAPAGADHGGTVSPLNAPTVTPLARPTVG